MPQIIWRPEALADVERLLEFLRLKNEEASIRAGRMIDDAVWRLADAPYLGMALNDSLGRRKLIVPFGKSAYVVYYTLDDNTVIIVRVHHGRESRPH